MMNIYFYWARCLGCLGCGTQDLRSLWWCADLLVVVCKLSVAARGPSSLTEEWTWVHCIGSVESQPLDRQRIPRMSIDSCAFKEIAEIFLYTFPSFPQWYHFVELQYNFTTRITALLKFSEHPEFSSSTCTHVCIIFYTAQLSVQVYPPL